VEISLEACIEAIRHAPDYVMEWRHGIILKSHPLTKEERQLLESLREEYRIKSQWLEYQMLNKNNLLRELRFTWKWYYKPLAEKSKAFYEIAMQVCTHPLTSVNPDLSPGLWMLLCEYDFCDSAMKNSGFTGKAKQIGQAAFYQQEKKRYDLLANPEGMGFSCEVRTVQLPAISALEQWAAFIASKDIEFRNTYYRDYIRTQNRCNRAIRDSPLQNIYLIDNELKIQGVGQRGKAQKKSPKVLDENYKDYSKSFPKLVMLSL